MSHKTAEQRFWEKVEKNGPDECWNWKAYKIPSGYGQFGAKTYDRYVYAHRFSYQLANGPIPDGKVIMHSCDNPSCVNPGHLRLGTQLDNMRDRSLRGRNPRGENAGAAKLSSLAVAEIREFFFRGKATNGELSRIYGVSRGAISSAVHRRTWKHI